MKHFSLRYAKLSLANIMQIQTVFPIVMYFEQTVKLSMRVMTLRSLQYLSSISVRIEKAR